jgi:AraC-like DNA-binding protein
MLPFRSTDHTYYQTVPRAVGAMAKSYPAGYAGVVHSHPRAQLLYAESGVMKVTTSEGFWVVPPQRAVWFPPQYSHRTGTLSPVEMRTLYIKADICPDHFPTRARIIDVSPLLRELILRATAMPVEYDEQGRDGKIIALIFEEIEWSSAPQLHMPTPNDVRLLRIQDAFASDPGDKRTLEEWASSEGVSCRTLARLFHRELGVSFRHWRHQMRSLAAIPRLAMGEPVTTVALELGYDTPAAFAAMFRRITGRTPSQYFAKSR